MSLKSFKNLEAGMIVSARCCTPHNDFDKDQNDHTIHYTVLKARPLLVLKVIGEQAICLLVFRLVRENESYQDACDRHKRVLDTYVAIEPYSGPPHPRVRLLPEPRGRHGYEGFIDLITPITIGKRSLEGLKYPVSRISHDDLIPVERLYRERTQVQSINRNSGPSASLTFTTASSYHNSFSNNQQDRTMQSASSIDQRPIDLVAVQAVVRQLWASHANETLNGRDLKSGLNDILSNCGIDNEVGTSEMERTTACNHGHPLQLEVEPPQRGGAENSNHPGPPTNDAIRGEKGPGKRLRREISWSSGECNDKKHRKQHNGGDEDENDGGGPGPSNHGKRPQNDNGGYNSRQRGSQGSQNGRFQGRTNYRKSQGPSHDDPDVGDADDEDGRPPPDCGCSAISMVDERGDSYLHCIAGGVSGSSPTLKGQCFLVLESSSGPTSILLWNLGSRSA